MSLRIIVKPDQIQNWIADRHGTPVRRRNTDADLGVFFDDDQPAATGKPDFETLSVDELIEAMKLNHLVMLVDQKPGNTFHKFIQHG